MSSLSVALQQISKFRGSAPALIDGRTGQELTYAALLERLARIGGFLRHGPPDGKLILSLLPDSLHQLIWFLGAVAHGRSFAPLRPDISLQEFENSIRVLKPALCLFEKQARSELRHAAEQAGVATLTLDAAESDDWTAGHSEEAFSSASGHLYLATSGTANDVRTIVFDTELLWKGAQAFCQSLNFLTSDTRLLGAVPMSYLGGLFNLTIVPLSVGGCAIPADPGFAARPAALVHEVRRHEANVLWLTPPQMASALLGAERVPAADLKSFGREVRAVLVGMGTVSLRTKLKFEDLFGVPVLENYGLSETGLISSETLSSRNKRTDRSVGEILPYMTIRCAPSTDRNISDALTEILVRSPYPCLGYFDEEGLHPLATQGDGWIATGDLGHIDASSQLTLDGRLRDIIKTNGLLVRLRDIEKLAEEHPNVVEAAAAPREQSDGNETYQLFVVPTAGCDQSGLATSIGELLRSQLPRHMWPQRIVAVADLPRTSTGKVRKIALSSDWFAS